MIILGFTGKKTNGKSTVCDMMKSKLWNNRIPTARINFKDPLVEFAKRLGWNGEKDEKGRRGLQLLGTDVVRECFDPDFWIKAWARTVMDDIKGFQVVLADDVRFDNEAQAVKSLGGKIIYIESPAKNIDHDNHKSEAGISMSYIDRSFLSVQVGLQYLDRIAEIIIQEFIDGKYANKAA